MKDGFIKVAAASPIIRVADCAYNAQRVIETIRRADSLGVKVLVFPELTLTGVSCFDLTGHNVLLRAARRALDDVIAATDGVDMLIFVGLPYASGATVCSVAAAVYDGELLALVPEEGASGEELSGEILFRCAAMPELNVAVELGDDSDSVLSPAARHALAGADLICRMASFPATVYSTAEAEMAARADSRRLRAGLLLAAPGKGESTTDRVYTGLCLLAENGELISEDERADSLAVSEMDVERLITLRRASGEFEDDPDYEIVWWGGECVQTELTRRFPKYPHLPAEAKALPAYCERMLDIQVSGLVKRMEYAHLDHCVVGISGGVDSTLCVMVCAMAMERMGLPSENVVACTLPCFGTSSRTKSNAIIVAEQMGAQVRVIDIGKAVYQHFDDIGHAHDDYSIAYENAQARERTQVLMDIANKCNGLDVGTEDLSEFIDGWCTFNGDHTSMYDVNLGLTKTQVRANVRYIADTTEDKTLKAALYDVLDCPVTPELLPIYDDMIEQKSEDAVGSYSLQDFFTWHMLVNGFGPAKTFRLAKSAWGDEFTDEELKRWLTSWCKRLFSQQFKRSCLMDGPAVMDFTVSPRTGFLMPSDGAAAAFLAELEEL